MPRRLALATLSALPMALLAGGIALSSPTSFTDAQANSPQVAGGQVSDVVGFPTNKQNEPTIARNPATGHFLAGSNDEQLEPACGPGPVRGATVPASDCSFYPNVGNTGLYSSADGVTWTNRGVLPGFTDGNPAGTLVSDGDPVLTFGPTYLGGGRFSRASGSTPASYSAYYASLASYATGKQKGN